MLGGKKLSGNSSEEDAQRSMDSSSDAARVVEINDKDMQK